MTLLGAVVLFAWLGAAVFLYVHATSPWRRRPAGVAVFVMAVVTFSVMTLAMLRATFGVVPPDYVRIPVYLSIAVGLWWKAVTAIRYRYGDLHNPPRTKETQ